MIRSVTDTALIWVLVTSCLVRAFNTVHSGCSPANHTTAINPDLGLPLLPRVSPADPFWGNWNLFRFLHRGDPQLAATFDQCFSSIRVGWLKSLDACTLSDGEKGGKVAFESILDLFQMWSVQFRRALELPTGGERAIRLNGS